MSWHDKLINVRLQMFPISHGCVMFGLRSCGEITLLTANEKPTFDYVLYVCVGVREMLWYDMQYEYFII